MATDTLSTQRQPAWPLLWICNYCVSKPYSHADFRKMTLKGFQNGHFREKARIIDIDCVKYPIIDVINLGRSLWPLDLFSRHHLIRVRYVFGKPTPLTFEEVREEICDLIVDRGWYTQGWENEQEFLDRSYSCTSMQDFMNSISHYGKWVF